MMGVDIDIILKLKLFFKNMTAVINWDEALKQVGGDQEFLEEVLNDLLLECDTAQQDLGTAISSKNFDAVMKAAHRIKGSASYLYCEQLRDTSFQLQNLGHSGTGLTDPVAIDALLANVTALYATFNENLIALKASIGELLQNKQVA